MKNKINVNIGDWIITKNDNLVEIITDDMSDLKYQDIVRVANKEDFIERNMINVIPTKYLEKRLYFLVPYNISPIQQAIQAGHAALEYANVYSDTIEYIDFIKNWKTWIILNGGTTNSTRNFDNEPMGTLNQYADELEKNNINYSYFHEPDLNDALSALCILVDERVFNTKLYPDYHIWIMNDEDYFSAEYLNNENNKHKFDEYTELMGSDIVFLKNLLNNKKLA